MHPLTTSPRTWETDRVLFEQGQWAVTEFGIENMFGPYHYALSWSDISQDVAWNLTWVEHMAQKNWVIANDFKAANDYARQVLAGAHV